jgi:hypothetical protein
MLLHSPKSFNTKVLNEVTHAEALSLTSASICQRHRRIHIQERTEYERKGRKLIWATILQVNMSPGSQKELAGWNFLSLDLKTCNNVTLG